jgi:LPPG:FO 2-phospho-L-lactate transferase
MKITALAGGVGGAKLLIGLQSALSPGDLTAIVNTGDDSVIYGVHVSPDVDIVTYWLAGIADRDRGWGIAGDTFGVVDSIAALGGESWFRLGDRDLASCLHRTERLRTGAPLSVITDEIRRALGVQTRVIPMSDDAVPTRIVCGDVTYEFQEWFVRERQQPEVTAVEFEGLDSAKPAPGVLDAISDADAVILCPSNPVVSLGPILALPEVRDRLREHSRVVAVSPIVQGAPIKGPADKLLAASGSSVTASGVAGLYADFCDIFVIDKRDSGEAAKVEALGMRPLVVDTLMTDPAASEQLARHLLDPT